MSPYLSVAFVNRNDQYTPDQKQRITKFIEYYSYYNKKYEGLFEFIICDWNPPPDKPLLKEAYPWEELGNVTHFTVPRPIHDRVCPDQSRPMLEYIGRNACIRRASAPFVLVINQDIFLSSSILEFLSKRCLSENHFYRADRCDFVFNYDADFRAWEKFDAYAQSTALCKHIRPLSYKSEISPSLQKDEFTTVYTPKKFFEHKKNNVIYSDFYTHFHKLYNFYYHITNFLEQPVEKYYKRFYLHTNASGDFLITPKKAFFDVHGFVESSTFYLHLDSYMCFQLFAAGYKQAILAHEHTVFHSDHSRSGREGRPESMEYKDHEQVFDELCLGTKSYKINTEAWGLRDYDCQ
jgi:hypothetical protein